jgi:hypothetical protein
VGLARLEDNAGLSSSALAFYRWMRYGKHGPIAEHVSFTLHLDPCCCLQVPFQCYAGTDLTMSQSLQGAAYRPCTPAAASLPPLAKVLRDTPQLSRFHEALKASNVTNLNVPSGQVTGRWASEAAGCLLDSTVCVMIQQGDHLSSRCLEAEGAPLALAYKPATCIARRFEFG